MLLNSFQSKVFQGLDGCEKDISAAIRNNEHSDSTSYRFATNSVLGDFSIYTEESELSVTYVI